MNKEIAILMAAGLGSRMRPVTENTPKPLVKVNGKPMIETVIDGLLTRGIENIYIVVGYLGEQFEALKDKYSQVKIIRNTEYTQKNNISSIHAVGDILKQGDCFICEADLVVSDPSIFLGDIDRSCYFGRMVEGHSDDWVFDLSDGRITRVGKGGDDTYNMVGLSFFKQKDAAVICDAINKAYKTPGHEQLFWDEIVDQQLDNIDLGIRPVNRDQIVEIDTVDELKAIDSSYNNIV